MGLDIVFMGTPDFARVSLARLLASPHRVRAVVSQPDRKKGRGQQLQSPPVAELAREVGLPLLQPESTSSQAFRRWVASFLPDIAVVAAFGHILGPRALAVPRLGCVNVHASLLPRWRGASPIAMALLHGDAEAGVSIMQMDAGMDTGAVFAMRGLTVAADDTCASLTDRLAVLGADLLVETLDRIERGEAQASPQPDEGVTLAPLFGKDDGEIRWDEPAIAIERRVRALYPWPGAWTRLGGKVFRILPGASVVDADGPPGQPGRILEARRQSLVVACGRGALRLGEVQLEGKKVMPAGAFLSGMPELAGIVLPDHASGA